jgi:two-component system cell cycle response regulator DivK
MSKKEILYIEDNFHNRRIVRKILEREGYSLFECEDGLEGYEMLRAMKPGIVLLDISLPTMDGMEIAGKVKEDPELQHIYLIALTASAMQGDRERFLAGGCDDYLSKPFRALDLVDMVNKYEELVDLGSPLIEPEQSELRVVDSEVSAEDQEADSVVTVEVRLPPAEDEVEKTPAGEPQIEPVSEAVEETPEEPEPVEAAVEEVPEAEAEPPAEAVEEPPALEAAPETGAAVEPPAEPEPVEAAAEEVQEAEVEPQAEAVEEAPKLEEDQPAAVEEAETAEPTPEPEAVEEPSANMDDRLGDTAELKLDPSTQEESAWALVTETVELQQAEGAMAETETAEEVKDTDADPQAESEADSTKDRVESLVEAFKGKNSAEAFRAEIMGMINPDNLKPADPNSQQS